MKKFIIGLLLGLGLVSLISLGLVAQEKIIPLKRIENTQINSNLGLDEQLWQKNSDKKALIASINYSLSYLNTAKATQAYKNYPVSGITRGRIRLSLIRFRQLLQSSQTPAALQAAIKKEFVLYQSIGNDNQGTVAFTGYFEPIYSASRQLNTEYRYPLYRQPNNFNRWGKPHPKREELEGKDGLLGKKSPLSGYELAWLKDRLEAYLVHVQGSAKLLLPNGKMMSVGVDGNTDYSYTSIGKELIKDGIFTAEKLSLPVVIDYFQSHPEQLNNYLPRNNRFIFFRETYGAPAKGSLGVPVTAERSIATDKSIMPPGALALIVTSIPDRNAQGEMESRLVSRYVLDQDTGSAIKGAGRVDIFMGTGKIAGEKAGLINHTGQLYYLLLK